MTERALEGSGGVVEVEVQGVCEMVMVEPEGVDAGVEGPVVENGWQRRRAQLLVVVVVVVGEWISHWASNQM